MIPADSPDIGAEYKVLLKELKLYKPELLDKQRILAVSKADLLDGQSEKSLRRHFPRTLPVILISSVTGRGIPELKDLLWNALLTQ
jgi:GTP-binding protein